jgi:sirohydrochlorin ferrochelatase
MQGLVVFGHGSRVESANESVRSATLEVARKGEFAQATAAFLELGDPDLPAAVRMLVDAGVTEIVVVPYFLTLGMHLQRDLPRIVGELRNIYKEVAFHVTEPLDGHPALVDAVLARAKEGFDADRGTQSTTHRSL